MKKRFRVGLVGAGNISEFHLRALQRLADVEIVGITDLDATRAQAVAQRFGLPATFASLHAMAAAGVDVVHILTPPSSHAELTLRALEHGCHVLVEKPLATSAEDCDRIAAAARAAGKVVGVDHAMLFDPFVARALRLVHDGHIGDVVAVDYLRSQSYPPYRGGPLPPQYRDGGYPFRDMGVHALYLVEAFLGDIGDVAAQFTTRDGDPNLLYNEWRALVRCEKGTGHVHLSWNVKPFQNLLLVQGTRGILRADLFGMSLTVRRARRLPEFAQRALNACGEAAKTLVQVPINILRVATGQLRRYHGLQAFVEQFYKNLAADRPTLVSAEDARSIVYWTERVARQADRAKESQRQAFASRLKADVLVTGASGFIGKYLLRRLLAEHEKLRVFVRRPSPELLHDPRVEIIVGDLGDPEAVERAAAGTRLVYHLGACCRGDVADVYRGTVAGTQNIVDSVLRHGARLVHISSLSVLHAAAMRRRDTVTETWPLDPYPGHRGLYTQTKLQAEQIVRQAVAERQLQAVILRPGQVVGAGGPVLPPSVGLFRKNRLILLGNGKAPLPLVSVHDVVDGILQAERHATFSGDVYHLVDDMIVTQNDWVREYQAATSRRLKVRRLPRWLLYPLALGVQVLARMLRRSPPLSIYRLRSSVMRGRFDCSAARKQLGWSARIGVQSGLRETFAGETAPTATLNGAPARHDEAGGAGTGTSRTLVTAGK